MIDLKALIERRAKVITDMRAIVNGAEGANLSGEDEERYNKLFAEQEGLRKQIEQEERQRNVERDLESRQAQMSSAPQGADADPSPKGGEERRGKRDSDEYRTAFRRYLAGHATGEEMRALQADADVSGGFVVASEQFATSLIQAVDDMVFIRPLATKHLVTQAESLGNPSLDVDPADADWTVEIATGSEDSTMAFGKRSLYPHPVAKLLKVSKKLLRVSAINVEQLVRSRLAYKFAVTEEKAFLTGSGANQPLGLFTASNDGIPTSRDVSTGNTTTSMTFDGLHEAKYTLKGGYWPRARWIFHRDGVKQLAKLKDGDGQYIWRESIRAGEPDRLMGLPVMMSEYAPNTFTTGLYVGLLGDFSCYWIADALSMQIQRLVELYAATNQDGFIGRMETDGMPVLGEAFVRVKLA